MNGNPKEIRSIRYGGMQKALDYDAIIWIFMTNGNHVLWPRKSQIGGLPGYGQYTMKELAPIGCRELVKNKKKKRVVPLNKWMCVRLIVKKQKTKKFKRNSPYQSLYFVAHQVVVKILDLLNIDSHPLLLG